MPVYEVTMQHNEKTFESLARMQYDLFCGQNRIVRTILSLAMILLGIACSDAWWGILAIAYGCYLTTSTYSSSNHTAHKLAKQIRDAGADFPRSRYQFTEKAMKVISLPEEELLGEPLDYSDVRQMGEDREYFYIFRDQYGGYMIPKSELDAKEDAFRDFIQKKTGMRFQRRTAPAIKLLQRLKERRRER